MFLRAPSHLTFLLLLSVLSLQYPTTLSQELQVRGAQSIHDNTILLRRDGDHDHHNPHAAPLLVLNETEILMHHAPTPPSYYTLDWEDLDTAATSHSGLILSHAFFMGLAFFVALPLSIILRSVKHGSQSIAVIAFYALSALGCSMSALYSKLTPNMYEGSAHGKHGYMVLLLALLLSSIDILSAIRRFIAFIRNSEPRSFKLFWNWVVLNKDINHLRSGPEYTGLIVEDPEELELPKISQECPDDGVLRETAEWANDVHQHRRNFSLVSEGTTFDSRSPTHSETTLQDAKNRRNARPKNLVHRVGNAIFTTLERFLVVAGFSQLLTGIVVYTGGCREHYLNGCLAHLIKGGIFWCYGLLSFARFLGSFAERGWAWNKAPRGDPYTAEFIESSLIFFYGLTNTWMERFGANSGDPFTTKQIQHISIAVMFWFAGLVGMGIESKRVRKWLAASIFNPAASPNIPRDAITEPPSYGFSFNPFPALVIGVTGAAMAAHFQTYLFQVQIHALWGNLLLGSSVLRCLTYIFLWLGPPTSVLPSRPPTEALGSFFLACGGLVFMFSTEEVTLAAMRRGRDDVMMFLNVAVAITCLGFCWTLLVVGFKGWLKSRQYAAVTYRTAA